MFNKQNFCHVASNNRNERKAGIFVYKTTDDLATVSTSGYFNEKIIDINLHDLIIHEWHDPSDRTKVQKNVLCVTERTLDNVGTVVIKSKWEGDIEQEIAALQQYVDNTFVKKDGTSIMSGPLKFRAGSFEGAIAGGLGDGIAIYKLKSDGSIDSEVASITKTNGFEPSETNTLDIGSSSLKWKNLYIAGKVYTPIINNGVDLTIPTPAQADTIALKSQVDTAANSGSQLTNKGVWYAKMYTATVAPSAEDGTNYADFSQTDGQGNPIIVTYNRINGAWVQDRTITPPADYNGYVTVTSKIWDIVEQSGQQGGLVLWAYNTKTFTPYPRIVSFEDAALTGTPTAPNLSSSSPNDQIVNKQSLDNALLNHGSGRNVGDIFFTTRKDTALNGAVACDGSTYNTTDFTGAQTIGELLEDGKVPYISMAAYATALSTNGSVGVFGWDGTGNTTFRVPSLNDIFIETGTAAQIGDYLAPGIPNITAKFNAKTTNTNTQGAIRVTNSWTSRGWDGGDNESAFEFDASTVSSVYKNDVSTVQPNTVRYRAMVQLAISATDAAVETCTQVLADVATLNTHKVIAFQIPNAGNNYTWYRKYADGWVEQGGLATIPGRTDQGSSYIDVVLPVIMTDANYTPMVSITTGGGYWASAQVSAREPSTTTIRLIAYWNANGTFDALPVAWTVSGMAAA